MASQAKTIEAKKDEFRAYLEKTGVVDQLTKVLVSLLSYVFQVQLFLYLE